MVLVRGHDYRRHWPQPIEQLGDSEMHGNLRRTEWGCFMLNVSNDSSTDGYCFARLSAKDFVLPFEGIGYVGNHRRRDPKASELPEFIVGQELSGATKMMRPSRHELGPPVYFDPKVLKRYYDEPSRYEVSFSAPGLGSA